MNWPKISIVTPSFNQAEFLEETLCSVLFQRYPNLEYIVIDGGSTDGSVEILERYADRLAYWVSEPDRGQAHAINKGLEKATGDILAYLNSDDVYLPNALATVAQAFTSPGVRWVTGQGLHFGATEGTYEFPPRVPRDPVEWLKYCPIYQPATFWHRSLYEKYGPFDESFHYTMDYEYWVRLKFGGEDCVYVPRPLAAFRYHESSKTVSQTDRFEPERRRLREKYLALLPPRKRASAERRLAVSDFRFRIYALRESFDRKSREELWREYVALVRAFPRGLATRAGLGCAVRILRHRPNRASP